MSDLRLRYILDENHNVIHEPDIVKWAKWFEHTPNRIVKKETVGSSEISTVFLAIDHRWAWGDGRPIVFETMIFGDDESYQERCCTWDEALEQHQIAVDLVKQGKAK